MASHPLNPAYRTIEVDEFLGMDLGDAKAELVDGTLWMMAGGSPTHAAVAANITATLLTRLRGSGCRPYGSDMPLRTGPASIRFPDVTVYCNNPASPGNDGKRLLDHARVVFEVLSPSTASNDQIAKLREYLALPEIAAVVFVDPDNQRVRLVDPDGNGGWNATGSDLHIEALGVTITHDEIFSRD
jgi:Uma2 family endonuclease